MTDIRQRFRELIDAAHAQGLEEGRRIGREETLAEMEAALAEMAPADVSTPKDAPQANGPLHARQRKARKQITEAEEQILSTIKAHPGLTLNELYELGVTGPGPIYKLVQKNQIRRIADPKPHLGNKSWVRFYPKNAPNDG